VGDIAHKGYKVTQAHFIRFALLVSYQVFLFLVVIAEFFKREGAIGHSQTVSKGKIDRRHFWITIDMFLHQYRMKIDQHPVEIRDQFKTAYVISFSIHQHALIFV